MIKSKVIEILQSLDSSELKMFGELVNSSFFNKNKNVKKLFAELIAYYPSFENTRFTKENIYSKIFPGKAYADKTFRNLMSDLNSLAERYFILKELDSRKLLEKYLLSVSFSKKHLLKHTEQALREADKEFEGMLFDGGNSYFYKHLIEMEKDFLEIHRNSFIKLNMKEGEYMIYSFLSKYMLFRMKLNNYRHKLGSQDTSELIEKFEHLVDLDPLIKYLEEKASPENELILVYHYSTKFMNDLDDNESFNNALKLFYRNKPGLNITEILNLYLTFTGFCAVKVGRGEKQYIEILFDLYKDMADADLLTGGGENLHITIFNNVVSIALMLGRTQWAKNFIDTHVIKLLPEFRENMNNYAYAWYYFTCKNYEKSLEHLGKVTLENSWIKSRTRLLQLRLYFELGSVEPFYSMYDSMKHYLKNDRENTEFSRRSDLLFINMLYKLAKIKFDINSAGKSDKLIKVKTEAESKLKGTIKDWFLLKIEEIQPH